MSELSDQTKAEQAAGRKYAEDNAKAFALAEANRTAEAGEAQAPPADLQAEADAVVDEVIAKQQQQKKEKRNG